MNVWERLSGVVRMSRRKHKGVRKVGEPRIDGVRRDELHIEGERGQGKGHGVVPVYLHNADRTFPLNELDSSSPWEIGSGLAYCINEFLPDRSSRTLAH